MHTTHTIQQSPIQRLRCHREVRCHHHSRPVAGIPDIRILPRGLQAYRGQVQVGVGLVQEATRAERMAVGDHDAQVRLGHPGIVSYILCLSNIAITFLEAQLSL